jgi:hypothetical protein
MMKTTKAAVVAAAADSAGLTDQNQSVLLVHFVQIRRMCLH